MPSPLMDLLLWNLQPPPGRRSWHGGPTPVGALRGVSAAQAAWRPTPRRKSIWEMALHIGLGAMPPLGKRWTFGEMVLGIAAHDAYHTGQIQLLKRLWEDRALPGRREPHG